MDYHGSRPKFDHHSSAFRILTPSIIETCKEVRTVDETDHKDFGLKTYIRNEQESQN